MSKIIYKNNFKTNDKLPITYEKIDWHDDFDSEHIKKHPKHIYGLYLVNNDMNIEEQWFDSKEERESKLTRRYK